MATICRRAELSLSSNSYEGRYWCRKFPHEGPYRNTTILRIHGLERLTEPWQIPSKKISDYEKVAPTIVKEVLIEGLIKAGMPNE